MALFLNDTSDRFCIDTNATDYFYRKYNSGNACQDVRIATFKYSRMLSTEDSTVYWWNKPLLKYNCVGLQWHDILI